MLSILTLLQFLVIANAFHYKSFSSRLLRPISRLQMAERDDLRNVAIIG